MRIYQLLTEGAEAYVQPSGLTETPVPASGPSNIAVLPFANLSSDPQQDYFSDGLTEDIITQLSKIRAYKVISRTSVMQYKSSPKSVKEIGKELGVTLILEGSVQRHGDQVRITAQLINAVTDEHIWADSYDRPMLDIFSIQREVALAIAAVLNTSLSNKETRELDYIPTTDLLAYDYYLRGKLLLENRNKADVLLARDYFIQAVNRDKTFAVAYSGLADTYLLSSFRGYEDPVMMLWQAKSTSIPQRALTRFRARHRLLSAIGISRVLTGMPRRSPIAAPSVLIPIRPMSISGSLSCWKQRVKMKKP